MGRLLFYQNGYEFLAAAPSITADVRGSTQQICGAVSSVFFLFFFVCVFFSASSWNAWKRFLIRPWHHVGGQGLLEEIANAPLELWSPSVTRCSTVVTCCCIVNNICIWWSLVLDDGKWCTFKLGMNGWGFRLVSSYTMVQVVQVETCSKVQNSIPLSKIKKKKKKYIFFIFVALKHSY